MTGPNFDPSTAAIVETPLPIIQPAAPGVTESATLTNYQPESMSLNVVAGSSGLLVLSEVYEPDWHAYVDGKRVDIPSYRVRKGDVISLRDKARAMIVIRHNLDTLDARIPAWLETGDSGLQVTVLELPLREQIDVPVREQLIVELYSK